MVISLKEIPPGYAVEIRGPFRLLPVSEGLTNGRAAPCVCLAWWPVRSWGSRCPMGECWGRARDPGRSSRLDGLPVHDGGLSRPSRPIEPNAHDVFAALEEFGGDVCVAFLAAVVVSCHIAQLAIDVFE